MTGDRIKSNSITGKQIDEKTLGTVPSATRAQKVTLADRATNAQRATNADNALSLGGTAAAGYLSFASRTIPSGVTVTGAFGIGSNVTATVTVDRERRRPAPITATTAMTSDITQVVPLPGPAPSDLTSATVNFANVGPSTPTPRAPGRQWLRARPQARSACISGHRRHRHARRRRGDPRARGSRAGFVVHAANATLGQTGLYGTWAYTAP